MSKTAETNDKIKHMNYEELRDNLLSTDCEPLNQFVQMFIELTETNPKNALQIYSIIKQIQHNKKDITQMNDTTKRTHEDTLTLVAYLIDSADYILQDVQEDYFERYDNGCSDDKLYIVHEYNRNRAKTATLRIIVDQIQQALNSAEISR